MTGVCGVYHSLLIQRSHKFVTISEDEEGRYVWDNIISPVQQQGGSFSLCPISGKVETDISHVTIQAIASALRDTSYLDRSNQELLKEGTKTTMQRVTKTKAATKTANERTFDAVKKSGPTMVESGPFETSIRSESRMVGTATINEVDRRDSNNAIFLSDMNKSKRSVEAKPTTEIRQSARVARRTVVTPKQPIPSSNINVSKGRDTKQISVSESPEPECSDSETNQPNKVPWDFRFRELMEYADEHGNCNVPQRWEKNPSLGRFVKINRQYYMRKITKKGGRKNPLIDERIALLDAIGFVWDIRQRICRPYVWHDEFRKLKQFHKKFGHFNVPNEPKYGRLYGWVFSMRYFQNMKFEKDTGLHLKILTPGRESQLNEIGFLTNEVTHGVVEKTSPPMKRNPKPKEDTPAMARKPSPSMKQKAKPKEITSVMAKKTSPPMKGKAKPKEITPVMKKAKGKAKRDYACYEKGETSIEI